MLAELSIFGETTENHECSAHTSPSSLFLLMSLNAQYTSRARLVHQRQRTSAHTSLQVDSPLCTVCPGSGGGVRTRRMERGEERERRGREKEKLPPLFGENLHTVCDTTGQEAGTEGFSFFPLLHSCFLLCFWCQSFSLSSQNPLEDLPPSFYLWDEKEKRYDTKIPSQFTLMARIFHNSIFNISSGLARLERKTSETVLAEPRPILLRETSRKQINDTH